MLVKVSGGHYKGLSENQATEAGRERQVCDNKNGGIPLILSIILSNFVNTALFNLSALKNQSLVLFLDF